MRQVAALSDICVKYISSQLSSLSGNPNILLPDELYIKILQHLRNQGLLSSASLSLFLISKIHSINFTSCVQINDECIQTICKMCPNIQNLVLSKCPMITDQGIQTIGTTCLGVKLLHISKCFQVTDAAFTCIFISSVFDSICTLQKDKEAKPLSGLIELDVSGTKITDDTVVHIGDSCPELKLLDLSDCNITVKSIEVIEEKLPGLKMLRASGCHLEYGTCLSRLPSLEGLVARQCPLIGDSAIIDLINNASSLSSLDLQWSGITDATINELSKINSKLVSLRLSWCSLVGESALANLLKDCVNLQTLDLSWRSLHDDTLNAVTSNCTRLKLLDISGCNELSSNSLMECGGEALEFLSLSWCRGLSDAAFKRIVERSPNLKTLDMSLCNNITPNTLATLAQCKKLQALLTYKCIQFTNVPYVDLFKNLPELTIVNLSECHITDLAVIELAQNASKLRMLVLTGCKGVTSKSLVALAQNCTNLESVNVSSTNVDDVGVSALAASCGGLVSLGLSGCKAISNISILAMASNLRVLQQVYLSYCPTVTEASLIQLAQKCAYLQVVELSNCSTATDALICEITMHSPLLQVLNVSGCHGLTDSSIDYLWLYGQHLTSLDVSRCPAITATALSSFSTLMPHVNIRKNGY